MERPLGFALSSQEKSLERRIAQGYLPRGYIDGCTLSNDTTDATNDVAIAAGSCRSTVNLIDGTPSTATRDQMDIDLPVSIIKQLDTAWAPDNYDQEGYTGGDRSGGRSNSSLSNTTWLMYAIGGRGLPSDVIFHDSATQSSVVGILPTGYTGYRRIGAVLRESATIIPFTQDGDVFKRGLQSNDYNSGSTGTSALTITHKCPTGIVVQVIANVLMNSGSSLYYGLVTALDETDSTPSSTNRTHEVQISTSVAADFYLKTNTSAQTRARLSVSNAAHGLSICTRGWVDSRGKNS